MRCEAKIRQQELKIHLKTCNYKQFDCPKKCGKRIKHLKLDNHLENDCIKLIIKCTYCDFEGTDEFINGIHKDSECQYVPEPCHNTGCEEMVKRGFRAEHRAVCPKELVQCKYVGICDKVMEREDEAAHYKSKTDHHLESAWLKLKHEHADFERKLETRASSKIKRIMSRRLEELENQIVVLISVALIIIVVVVIWFYFHR